MITAQSSKEDVGLYLVKTLNLREEIKDIIIKEDISGDILFELTDEDYKLIGIKPVPMRKIKGLLEKIKDKFGEKNYTEVISIYSDSNEVSEFFKKSLNFNGDLNNLDGKGLLELTDETIKNLGLNLGQRKKLVKYISYFKTLKIEPPKELTISKESSPEEVVNYLKKKLKFSDEGIKSIKEDLEVEGGDSLAFLEDSDIDNCNLTEEEKLNLKNLVNDLKKENEEVVEEDIIITKETDKDTLLKFFKNKCKISDKGIDAIITGLEVEDGETFLLLEPNDFDGIEDLNDNEKNKLKNALNSFKQKKEEQIKPPTKESKLEDLKLYLSKILKISEKGIKEIEDLGVENGETFFCLQDEDIDGTQELTKEEKDNIKNLLKKENGGENENNDDNNNDPKKDVIPEDKNPKNDNDNLNNLNQDIPNNPKAEDAKIDLNNNKDLNKDIKDEKNINEKKIGDEKNNNDEKIEGIINGIYEGETSNKIFIYHLNKVKKSPLINDSKFNVFFILSEKEAMIDFANLGVFVDKTGFFSLTDTFKNFTGYIIYENEFINIKDETIKSYIIQVPMNKPVKKLSILLNKDKMFNEDYSTDIYIDDNITNYFNIHNANNDITIKINRIFEYYLNFFFKQEKAENVKISLMKALIKRIKEDNNIQLKPNTVLRFLKYCAMFKLEPKNLEHIELIKLEDYKLKKDYLILSDDIDCIAFKNENERNKLINLLVKLYANYNTNYLIDLVKGKYSEQCSKTILDLLNNKEIKFDNLNFENEENYSLIKKNILFAAKTKADINFIIKMSKGLTECLNFIFQYFKEICEILEKNASSLKGKETNYLLTLVEPTKEDDIDNITDLIKKIFELLKQKHYKIINLEDIFASLKTLYLNKSLNELCKLNLLVDFLRAQNAKERIFEEYYTSIHVKGINSIKKGELDSEKIIQFLQKQDVYYYKDSFKKSPLRDPIIFKYIPITKKENDNDIYLKNIQLIKDNKLWNLYNEPGNLQSKFFSTILEQIENFKDLKVIFDIFPIKYINQNLALLINKKVNENIYSLLDAKEEDYELIFDVFNNIIKVNEFNNLDLVNIVKLIQINYDLTAKYYFHILKDKNMSQTTNTIKNLIINFFIDRNREGKISAESFITLLLLADKQFSQFLLNQMNNMIAKEADFYLKEETPNFLLFKLFFEKCGDLMKEGKLSDGTYLIESLDIKKKMQDNYTNFTIKYDIVSNLIADENSFYKKIFVIFDEEEKQAKKIFANIKEAIQKCVKKFELFEIMVDYYNTFFANTKKGLINLIKVSLNKLKQSKVNEIINLDEKNFIVYNGFNFNESIEESKKIRYKNSLFFMAIYKKKSESEVFEKSEEDILKESIENYKDSLTRIIKQKETKEPFFNINYVNEFTAIIQNNNMEKEIEFIAKEFEGLGKAQYINNELLNDLINFSNKNKVVKLLQGLI